MSNTKPNVLVLRAPGTNCDVETAYAFELAGARAERIHINRLLEDPSLPDRFQILCFPGGFSFGDDVASGRILAATIHHHLTDTIRRFRDARNLQRFSDPDQVGHSDRRRPVRPARDPHMEQERCLHRPLGPSGRRRRQMRFPARSQRALSPRGACRRPVRRAE